LTLAVTALVALSLLAAPVRADEQLGRISFHTSGSAEAQPYFIRGVLLLHSFEFDDAAEAFREARRIDPGFAMAYWGEALTHNHPLWRYQNRDAALKVLSELGPTPEARRARAPTPREKAYLAAVDVLYGEGDKPTRDRAYAAALETIAGTYPDDDEAKAFQSLALLGTNLEPRDYAVDMRAAALVEDVFLRNEQHPGALHYMIHAYDNPVHAPLGLRAAKRYSRIAANAAHALHMTSHIFFALGMWDEAVAANEVSWAASAARVERKKLTASEHGYHAYLWLCYAYLQQGRFDDARRVVDRMGRLIAEAPGPGLTYHYAAARASWVIDSERWDDLPKAADAVAPASPGGRAASLFADGLAAARRGEVALAEQALSALELVKQSTASTSGSHHGMSAVSATEREGVAVTALQLSGVIALARGETEGGLALLRQAADNESRMQFDSGPPLPAKPAYELLGEALAAAGHPVEAADAFRAALKRAPGRRLSLRGLADSEKQARR
jgi:tetratricopeptide (TPR) repeat protein